MAAVVVMVAATAARAEPVIIVVLGDSLTAGHGLALKTNAFPAQLQAALVDQGVDALVINAGVSGDTSAGGLARLAWSMADGPDLAIIELGANDALRGLAPDATYENLNAILDWLGDQGIPVLLAGMLAPPNIGGCIRRPVQRYFPAAGGGSWGDPVPIFSGGRGGRCDVAANRWHASQHGGGRSHCSGHLAIRATGLGSTTITLVALVQDNCLPGAASLAFLKT